MARLTGLLSAGFLSAAVSLQLLLAGAVGLVSETAIAGPASAAATPVEPDGIAKMLTGKFVGDGVFVDHSSGAKRGIKLDILGTLEGDKLTLVEDTAFSDGEKQHKVWVFTKASAGEWIGRRSDVIGEARVSQNGSNVKMSYKAHVLKDGKTWDLKFNEAYEIKSPDLIISKTEVSYLFLTVGVADLTIRRAGK